MAGFIDTHDYDGELLTWTTNGYAGQVFKRSGPFSATRDVGILRPKPHLTERLDLDYFAPVLTLVFSENASGRRKESGAADYTKLFSKSAAGLLVAVPVDVEGLPDLGAQQSISARYLRVATARAAVAQLAAQVTASDLAYPHIEGDVGEFAVTDLFTVHKGDGGLTRKAIRDMAGEVPVHTGSSRRNEVAGHINRAMYVGENLTWAADGYAGEVYARVGPFAANSHCGILTPLPDMKAKLHLPFFEFALSPVLKAMAVGRFKPDGSPDYTRVGTNMARRATVTLPIDKHGEPDLVRQVKATRRMTRLRDAQAQVREEVERIARVVVTVGEQ